MARPELEISAEQVFKMARAGMKTTEIADVLGCSADTLERRFAGDLAKGRATLKMNLRLWQLKAAEKLNPAILIWLGKQLLGQKDTIGVSQGDGGEIKITLGYERGGE